MEELCIFQGNQHANRITGFKVTHEYVFCFQINNSMTKKFEKP